jgi:MSHA biogenesis protein MshK
MVAGVKTIRGVALLLVLLPVAAGAQTLSDPTRPPVEIGEGGGAYGQDVAPVVVKGLSSVIISTARCAAIIDGKTIRLGEKYGDATLVEITAHGVTLQGAHGRRGMALFPDVGMKASSDQPALPPAVTCKMENQNAEYHKTVKKLPRQNGLKEKK